jgi:signal peptide peptidase SppA
MDQFSYARIMARLLNTPLLVHPRTAMTVYNVMSGRFGTSPGAMPNTPDAQLVDDRLEVLSQRKSTPKASRFAGDAAVAENGRTPEPYRISSGGVGILSVNGELVNRGAWTGSQSGMTSYEGIKYQLARLEADSRVKSVILDIDSPGGEAVGFDLAASSVRKLNETKPVIAVVNGMAASAAYGLASGARRIVQTPTGIAGSIGVVLLHLDMSKNLEAQGITPTLVFAGAHKVDGNPFEGLSEDVRSALQDEVDTFYTGFLSTVGAGRSGRLSAKAARATEARTYIGQEAVDAKLADELGSFEDVLATLSRRGIRKEARSQPMKRGATLDLELDTDAGSPPSDCPQGSDCQCPSAAQNSKNISDARKQGSAAQVTRLAAILADDRSKGRERIAMKIAVKAPDMSADDVLELAAETQEQPVASMAERTAATGANNVTGSPEKSLPAADKPEVEQPDSGWAKAVAKTNSRTASRFPNRRAS